MSCALPAKGCPSGTPLNGIGHFNSYFNGQDLYNNWQGMYPLFSSINANAFLNRMCVYVMPGEGVELGDLKSSHKRIATLTPREHEIMTYVITGMLNKQIAAELGIAEDTVKIHRGRVMQKLGVVSVAELVRLCERAGVKPGDLFLAVDELPLSPADPAPLRQALAKGEAFTLIVERGEEILELKVPGA